jgi:hypothetical protein
VGFAMRTFLAVPESEPSLCVTLASFLDWRLQAAGL